MRIVKQKNTKATETVYLQFRQARRVKGGKLIVVATKTRTIQDATIAKVWAALESVIPTE